MASPECGYAGLDRAFIAPIQEIYLYISVEYFRNNKYKAGWKNVWVKMKI